jgi:chaperone modulatory protein CbpM
MLRETELVAMIAGLHRAELRRWVARGWVAPERRDGAWHFREIDVARVRLIVDMRREMQVREDDLPLFLSLVDQVYSLRRELRGLAGAVAAQPEPMRAAIARHVRETRGGGEKD